MTNENIEKLAEEFQEMPAIIRRKLHYKFECYAKLRNKMSYKSCILSLSSAVASLGRKEHLISKNARIFIKK
jgi:hypothetical protein